MPLAYGIRYKHKDLAIGLPEDRMTKFDLDRCMRDGGKCLAGDRPARVVCSDRKGGPSVVALVERENGLEVPKVYFDSGRQYMDVACDWDLRNLPEFKEVEVTLWTNAENEEWYRVEADPNAMQERGWEPYGPPVTVRFEKGE